MMSVPDLGFPSGVLRVGQQIEVFDDHPSQKKWCEAKVIEETPTEVKVHFKASG